MVNFEYRSRQPGGTMQRHISGFAFILTAALLFYGAGATAAPTHNPYPVPSTTSESEDVFPATHDVLCHGVLCGTMTINTYEPAKYKQDGVDFVGAEISGVYNNITGKASHFIQVIKTTTQAPKWIDPANTPVPVPFVDTPPGGYQGDPFDYRVYYDEGEFPNFFDAPAASLGLIQAQAGKSFSVTFETWIVCVLDESYDDVANTAKGDTYTVATLLGWDWGYTAKYDGAGDVTDPANYSSTVADFHWLTGTPTAPWFAALDQTYGAGATTDWFNVNIGDCDFCIIPEPNMSLWLMLLGMVALMVMTYPRRRFQR
jgi:hypothetical protein